MKFALTSTAEVAMVAVLAVVVAAISLTATYTVFAENYEKSQGVTQVNNCGNYWFPINVLCSNLNTEIQGDENSVEVTAGQEDGNVRSTENLGAPFP
jgi:uncharacterized OB-fold protein